VGLGQVTKFTIAPRELHLGVLLLKVVLHFTLQAVPPSKAVRLLPHLPNRFRHHWFFIFSTRLPCNHDDTVYLS